MNKHVLGNDWLFMCCNIGKMTLVIKLSWVISPCDKNCDHFAMWVFFCTIPVHEKYFFIPHHTILAGYFGFTVDVLVSVHLSVCILFPDDNLSKHQWIFTKLGMCIDVVEIWFGIANGQISSNFVICPRHVHIFISVSG